MFIKTTSDNPEISFVLQKNPASGMTIRSIRKGMSYGWYNDDKYLIYFKDSDGENSYSKSEDDIIDYNNTLRYNSSLCVINLMTEYFRHLLSDKYSEKDKDIDANHSVEILNLFISTERMVSNFNKSFPDLRIDIEKKSGKTYNVVFSYYGRFSDLIKMVTIFSLFMVLSNRDEYMYVDESLTKKFVDIVKSIDTPYYIKYLFKVRFFGNRHNLFDKFVGYLNTDKHQLIFGDTHKQRINFVLSELEIDRDVIDYGCGEGRYVKPIIKHISKTNRYIGFDIDDEVAKKAKKKVKHLNDGDVEHIIITKLDDLLGITDGNEDSNIVLSEVVEHMKYGDAVGLIKNILSLFKPNKLIITTPNKDFNKFYYLEEDEFRHDDHKFELTTDGFDDFINTIFDSNYIYLKHNIGDIVENVTPTQGVVLVKK